VTVGVKVGWKVRLAVGGMVVRITVDVSGGTGETVPRKPQKEGRLAESVVQAVRNDKKTKHTRMLL
jgi:hypothetical protein